ncbi:unnamed protein product, partial [Urochloa humidicola]
CGGAEALLRGARTAPSSSAAEDGARRDAGSGRPAATGASGRRRPGVRRGALAAPAIFVGGGCLLGLAALKLVDERLDAQVAVPGAAVLAPPWAGRRQRRSGGGAGWRRGRTGFARPPPVSRARPPLTCRARFAAPSPHG